MPPFRFLCVVSHSRKNDDPFRDIKIIISTRGFSVRGRSSNLVLLRSTDRPLPDEHNVARLQASSLSSTVAIVSAGLNKIQEMVGSTTSTAAAAAARTASTSSASSSFRQNSPDQ